MTCGENQQWRETCFVEAAITMDLKAMSAPTKDWMGNSSLYFDAIDKEYEK